MRGAAARTPAVRVTTINGDTGMTDLENLRAQLRALSRGDLLIKPR
jgi:hypothetical protein